MPNHDDSAGRIPFREWTRPVVCIRVIGVGGGGNNAVNRMIDLGLENVEFVYMDTDLQSLRSSKAKVKLQVGAGSTAGRRATLDESDNIVGSLKDADMVIITAGLGGGTGTGIAPIVASAASALGLLTVAVVTLPFAFEGKRRMRRAHQGLQELLDHVDTLLVISNDDLLVPARDMKSFNTFEIVDDVVHRAVQGLSGILAVPGVVNRDFADMRVTMAGMGYAAMGTAARSGPQRASEAALAAMASPALKAAGMESARGILINIAGSTSLKLSEVQEASRTIQCAAREGANTVCGVVLNDRLGDEIEITIIASGFDEESRRRAQHRSLTRIGIEKSNNNPCDLDRPERRAETQALIALEPEPDLALPLSATAEDPFDEDLLTVLDGPPFDLNLPGSLVDASPEADLLLKAEIARVRQAALAAYTDMPTMEARTASSKAPEEASFAQILEGRKQIHGMVEVEREEQSDEEETVLQGQVAPNGVLPRMVRAQMSESVSKLDIQGLNETPTDRAIGGAGDSGLNDAQLNAVRDEPTPTAAPEPPAENLYKLAVEPKNPTLDFNGRLNRKPDFSVGIE